MKPATVFSLAFVAATQIFGVYAATKTTSIVPTQAPSTAPIADQLTSHGCYKSGGNLTVAKAVRTFLTSGNCWEYCKGKDYLVIGLHATSCYCGMVYPPKLDLTDDKNCNYSCPGYPQDSCGGLVDGMFSIYNTGIDVLVDDMEPVETTSTAESTTKASKTSAATDAATTAAEAPAETTTAGGDSDKKKSGPNTAAIAAGSVVGVLAVLAIIGAAVFVIRRRRNAEIEEEHRRNAAVNAFINGSKPPGSSGSISMTDSRLDPVMAHRRLSDGSIADNQDYSRRILRVTNA